MRTETVDATVRFAMTRVRVIQGGALNLYKRRTWLPSGEDWVTDYGIEFCGFTFWVHLPDWMTRALLEAKK